MEPSAAHENKDQRSAGKVNNVAMWDTDMQKRLHLFQEQEGLTAQNPAAITVINIREQNCSSCDVQYITEALYIVIQNF